MFKFIQVTFEYLKAYTPAKMNLYTLSNEILNTFSIHFQHCCDVAEINPGNHAVTTSLISKNFTLEFKKSFVIMSLSKQLKKVQL